MLNFLSESYHWFHTDFMVGGVLRALEGYKDWVSQRRLEFVNPIVDVWVDGQQHKAGVISFIKKRGSLVQ